MANKYKCPICGCEEYYKLGNLITGGKYIYDSDWGERACRIEEQAELKAEARLCKKCGHIDLFGEWMLERIKGEEERLKQEIAEREERLLGFKNNVKEIDEKIIQTKDRLAEISKLLLDENITIKQHKDLKEELKAFKPRQKLLLDELEIMRSGVSETELELKDLKYRLENVAKLVI